MTEFEYLNSSLSNTLRNGNLFTVFANWIGLEFVFPQKVDKTKLTTVCPVCGSVACLFTGNKVVSFGCANKSSKCFGKEGKYYGFLVGLIQSVLPNTTNTFATAKHVVLFANKQADKIKTQILFTPNRIAQLEAVLGSNDGIDTLVIPPLLSDEHNQQAVSFAKENSLKVTYITIPEDQLNRIMRKE